MIESLLPPTAQQAALEAAPAMAGAVAKGLLLSAALGLVIAVLHRLTRGARGKNPGLFPTLVLLSTLITLVTMAVGQNIAVAFTLVGTLAIVRFRTTVSDVRDTAFVIFAVATGIAAEQQEQVAVVGVGVVSLVVLLLHAAGTLRDRAPAPAVANAESGEARGSLTVAIVPPDADPAAWSEVFGKFGVRGTLASARAERDRSRLQLTFEVTLPDRARAAEIATALLERPEVVDAQLQLRR